MSSRVIPSSSGFIETAQLFRLKLKAMRAGVWFRALPRIDRVLVDLTIRVAGNVRSFVLAESILTVVRKLDGFMESRFLRAVRERGFPLAGKLGLIAQGWGNASARSWKSDGEFARYLAAMFMNERRLFGG